MERIRHAWEIVERARHEELPVTFHISKVKKRRWDWELNVRYTEADPVSGQLYPQRSFLYASKSRDELVALKERLEASMPPRNEGKASPAD